MLMAPTLCHPVNPLPKMRRREEIRSNLSNNLRNRLTSNNLNKSRLINLSHPLNRRSPSPRLNCQSQNRQRQRESQLLNRYSSNQSPHPHRWEIVADLNHRAAAVYHARMFEEMAKDNEPILIGDDRI